MGSIYKRGNTYEIIGTPVEHIILPKRCEIPHRGVRGAKLPGAIKENVRNSYILSINDKVQKSRVINSVRLQHIVRLFSSIKCFFYIGD